MGEATARERLQAARYALLCQSVIPRMDVIRVPLSTNLFEVFVETFRLYQVPNLTAEHGKFRRVHALRSVILLNQACQRSQRTVRFGLRQGWYQVVDNDRVRASLGLSPFARIVHYERV